MNIDPMKFEIPNISFKIVIENLDLLSNLNVNKYLYVDKSTYKLSEASWFLFSSPPSEIFTTIEATFFAATQNKDAKDIETLYQKSFSSLSKLEKTYDFDRAALKLLEDLRGKYSFEGRITKDSRPTIVRARTAFVGGRENRIDRQTQDWVYMRWQMYFFVRELEKLTLVPEYQEICSEVKKSLPKAPPETPEGYQSLLSQLGEAKKRLKKYKGDPIEPKKSGRSMINGRAAFCPSVEELAIRKESLYKTGKVIVQQSRDLGHAAFCPSLKELTKAKKSLNVTETVKSAETKDPFTESILATKKALIVTGKREKLIQEERVKSTTVASSTLVTSTNPIVSDNMFKLSPLQEQIYEIQESFHKLGPQEQFMRMLNATMEKVLHLKEELECDQTSSEEGGGEWSSSEGSEEPACFEVTLQELEGLTDSEDSEEALEEHGLDPEHQAAYGQMIGELKSKHA